MIEKIKGELIEDMMRVKEKERARRTGKPELLRMTGRTDVAGAMSQRLLCLAQSGKSLCNWKP